MAIPESSQGDLSIHYPLCYHCVAEKLFSTDSQSHNNIRISFWSVYPSSKRSPNWPARSLFRAQCCWDKKQNFASRSLGITKRGAHFYLLFPCPINSWLGESSAYIVHWYETYTVSCKTAP